MGQLVECRGVAFFARVGDDEMQIEHGALFERALQPVAIEPGHLRLWADLGEEGEQAQQQHVGRRILRRLNAAERGQLGRVVRERQVVDRGRIGVAARRQRGELRHERAVAVAIRRGDLDLAAGREDLQTELLLLVLFG